MQFSKPKTSFRPPRYGQQTHAAGGYPNGRYGGGGMNGSARDYETGSMLSYIPDDVSSIHSSALGGAGLSSAYPHMFSNFHPDQWPGLPGVGGGGRPGAKGRGRGAESIAGESIANSEFTDASASVIGGKGVGQGGASLGAGLSETVSAARPTSYTQDDRLKQYVEHDKRMGLGNGFGRRIDDDEKSISTAFASQIGSGFD
jgi:regulator of nonsense transcripts 1